MDIQSEKLELIKLLLDVNDKSTLEAVKNILEAKKKEVWEKLTPEQQEEINIVIQKENRGDIVDF